ncbi:MAG TPA: sigma-70 family RNA polymerase sigma factor [Cerasibacillus sp.]|uniref:sigma-70 family RNA polymerase sigma factor n=1 Tax=Cerasibacillus sp. TaxID=2498711 RepID=UPI002F3FD06B
MHLVDRLKEKDEHALIEVMNTYGDYLLRTAYLLVKDHHTAEEAVQDTFITAFEKIHQLEDEQKLKSWLTTIVINRCRAQMRKWSWKNIFTTYDVFERIKENEPAQSPEDFILKMAQNEKISDAILQLDYKYREVITLFYFNDMKIKEIARHIQSYENTVKSRLKRARILLKQIVMKGDVLYDEENNIIEKPTQS